MWLPFTALAFFTVGECTNKTLSHLVPTLATHDRSGKIIDKDVEPTFYGYESARVKIFHVNGMRGFIMLYRYNDLF